MGMLESQQATLEHAESGVTRRENGRPPSSASLAPSVASSSYKQRKRNGLKSSKSVGEGLKSLRNRVSSHNQTMNPPTTPDSITNRSPRIPGIRESFRSALTSHSSLGHTTSSINTAHTSISGRSSNDGESFIKVRREDWDEGATTDVDMSVDDVLGMYENGFESGAGSVRGSLDNRSIRSADGRAAPTRTKTTPEIRSTRSLQLERPATQPGPCTDSRPSTPSKLRPNAGHRRSQSASILLLGIPKAQHPGAMASPTLHTPVPGGKQRTSIQIMSNEHTRPPTAVHSVPRDRYGFKKASHYISIEQYDAWDKQYSQHLERRSKKWHALMRSYGLSTDHAQRFPPKSEKVKRYVRKGIPPEFRGQAWFWYAGGPGKLAKEPGLYWGLVEKAKPENGILTDNDREHIERDLNRTFPDNIRFKPDPTTTLDAQAGAGGTTDGTESSSQNPKGRHRQTKDPETPILQALRRLLQAFAIHNPQIGYCQSLNFIAGLLLLFLDSDEEKSFVLLNIVTSKHLPGTHGVALEGANIDIAVLMSCVKDTLPQVWSRLDDKGPGVASLVSGVGGAGALRLPTVSLATTAWFMSLFVGTLPIECVLRVWDCLFFEGSKTLFRIALAIFKHIEPRILAVNDPMEVFQVVQTVPRGLLDVNALMDICFRRRGGFGAVSQGLVERRRAERRAIVKEGVAGGGEDEGPLRRLKDRLRRQTARP